MDHDAVVEGVKWLHLEDIHEIQYDDHTHTTVVWDSGGDERLRLPGHLTEDLVHAIVRFCNRIWEQGRRVGRMEKAAEIRQALAEGADDARKA